MSASPTAQPTATSSTSATTAAATAADGASASMPLTPKPPGGRHDGPKTPRAAKVIVKTSLLEGGGKVEERGDGSKMQINADGSTVETFSPDSPRRHETKTNGDWLDVAEDGTETKFDSVTGTKVTSNKDGSSKTEHSDGMIVEESPLKRIEIRTDGSRLEVDKESGVSLESFEDGTQVQVCPF